MSGDEAVSGPAPGEQDRRLQVLLAWRTRTIVAGWPVPGVADLRRIAIADDAMPPGVNVTAVDPWRRTLSYLLVQMRQRVFDPVNQLPDDLKRPAAPEPGPSDGDGPDPSPGETEPTAVRELRRWRTQNRAVSPVLRDLKDSHLRNIVRTGSRTEAAVRQLIPRGLARHAAEIAEIVDSHLEPAEQARPAQAAAPDPAPPPDGSGDGAGRAEARPGTGDGGPGPESRPRFSASVPPPPSPPGGGGPRTGGGSADEPAPPGSDEDLTDLELADGDYAPDPPELRPGQELVRGTTVLRWPKLDSRDAVVLYRVVTLDDDYRPQRPQEADPATVTRSTTWTDDRPFESPVRQVQVWTHIGSTTAAAAAARPTLYAETQVVARLREPFVGLRGRSVVGNWSVPRGVGSVQVLRVLRSQVRGVTEGSLEFQINDEPNLTGFVDSGVEAADYVYLAYVRAFVNGDEVLSDPQHFPVSVRAELTQVTDLRVELRREEDGPPLLDLWWTRPRHCRVRVYITPDAPEPGAAERVFDAGELARMKLVDDHLVRHPDEPDGPEESGRRRVRGVEWPEGWTFAYVTAVAEVDGRIWVGRSVLQINLPPVRDAQIVERTHRQILVFDWPTGADNVLAYVGAPRQDLRRLMADTPEPDQISAERYERQGGLYFRYPLPAGWVVHVMGQAYSAGRSLHGPAVQLPYPGLHHLDYALTAVPARKGGPAAVGTLRISSRADLFQDIPYFALVFREDRLPLHHRDGRPLDVYRAGHANARPLVQFQPDALLQEPGSMAWNVRLEGLVGYVRLFVCPDPSQRVPFALTDPPVDQLLLMPPTAPPGGTA